MNKVVREVLASYKVEGLKARMVNLPVLILDKKKSFRTLKDAFADTELARETLESELLLEINEDKDAYTGKHKFSNEASRSAELKSRKMRDRKYQSALADSREKEAAYQSAQDEIEMLVDLFKATLYVARLTAAELEFMAAETDTGTEQGITDTSAWAHK